MVLTTSSLSCTICLFVFIRELFKPTSGHASIYLQLILVCIQVAIILTVVLSADLPTEKVRNAISNQPFVLLFERFAEQLYKTLKQVKLFQEQVMLFSTQPVDLNERTEVKIGKVTI